jgi:hypothetical protein
VIPISNYAAEFAMRDERGKQTWRPCDVVGVTAGDSYLHRFVVIVRGPSEYVDVVDEVRRVLPSPTLFA